MADPLWTEEMMAQAGPKPGWTISEDPSGHWRYRLSRYPEGAWEFSDGMLGATGRGPIRAFIRWLRWRREYKSKPPGHWASE